MSHWCGHETRWPCIPAPHCIKGTETHFHLPSQDLCTDGVVSTCAGLPFYSFCPFTTTLKFVWLFSYKTKMYHSTENNNSAFVSKTKAGFPSLDIQRQQEQPWGKLGSHGEWTPKGGHLTQLQCILTLRCPALPLVRSPHCVHLQKEQSFVLWNLPHERRNPIQG